MATRQLIHKYIWQMYVSKPRLHPGLHCVRNITEVHLSYLLHTVTPIKSQFNDQVYRQKMPKVIHLKTFIFK